MSDIAATDEQMGIPHPYEDEYQRWTAWTFDNILRKLAREAHGVDEADEAMHWYGQDQMNRGNRQVAEAWGRFCKRYVQDIISGHFE